MQERVALRLSKKDLTFYLEFIVHDKRLDGKHIDRALNKYVNFDNYESQPFGYGIIDRRFSEGSFQWLPS